MLRCPYCKGPLEKRIDFIHMSTKRRAVLDEVINAGPAGINTAVLMRLLFPHNKSEVVVRTTIHNINKAIKPLKIVTKAGKVRLDEH